MATICDKCGICFDLDYAYDDILIANKNEYGGHTQLIFVKRAENRYTTLYNVY